MEKSSPYLHVKIPYDIKFVTQQWVVLKAFLLIYFSVFASVFVQIPELYGKGGLLPVDVLFSHFFILFRGFCPK